MIRYLALMLLTLCTSCIQIGSDPQPMSYYLLDSMPSTTSAQSDKIINIDIEITKFPDYLDKNQIATNDKKNNISFSKTNRWAEPLQDNLIFTIRENLALMLPNANLAISPWERSAPNAIKLKLLVNKFSGKLESHSLIDIRWSIISNDNPTSNGHFTDQQPIGKSYNDLVAGLNQGINQLSQVLVLKLIAE